MVQASVALLILAWLGVTVTENRRPRSMARVALVRVRRPLRDRARVPLRGVDDARPFLPRALGRHRGHRVRRAGPGGPVARDALVPAAPRRAPHGDRTSVADASRVRAETHRAPRARPSRFHLARRAHVHRGAPRVRVAHERLDANFGQAFWFSLYSIFATQPTPEPPITLGGRDRVAGPDFVGLSTFALFTGSVSAAVLTPCATKEHRWIGKSRGAPHHLRLEPQGGDHRARIPRVGVHAAMPIVVIAELEGTPSFADQSLKARCSS